MAEQTPEQLLEQQKANCIFCKIVAGEIESKKVFENERFLGILDIRPAAPGHVLLLPKEHAPILPLLPQEQQKELFSLASTLAGAIKKAMIAQKVTLFIANGGAAGQQSPHFLAHLIPREPGDGLDRLDLAERTIPQTDTLVLGTLFSQATQQMLTHLGVQERPAVAARKEITPVPSSYEEVAEAAAPAHIKVMNEEPIHESDPGAQVDQIADGETQEFADSHDALQAVLAQNPELRKLLIAEPSLVEDYVAKSENLKRLFAGVDVHALSAMLRRQDEGKQGDAQRTAAAMSEEELFAFIDGNEGLRTWIVQYPEEFAQNLAQNPRLAAFFAGVDVLELAKKYNDLRGVPDAR